MYVNDITTDIDSVIRLFADDCVCYRDVNGTKDIVKLQEDIDRLGCWARKWSMRFQPVNRAIGIINFERLFPNFIADTMNWFLNSMLD